MAGMECKGRAKEKKENIKRWWEEGGMRLLGWNFVIEEARRREGKKGEHWGGEWKGGSPVESSWSGCSSSTAAIVDVNNRISPTRAFFVVQGADTYCFSAFIPSSFFPLFF